MYIDYADTLKIDIGAVKLCCANNISFMDEIIFVSRKFLLKKELIC